MPLPTTVRWRRARTRRVIAAAVLASLGGAGAALLATGPAAPLRSSAQTCLPVLCTSSSSSSTSSRSSSSTSSRSTSSSTSSHSSTTSRSSSSFSSSFTSYQPVGTPLPTLPPPTPGSPPQPPSLEVQAIQLVLASSSPPAPASDVLVQATLEAQRGADTYSVPHATVSFTITSSPGSGAGVDPQQADSGDTGVAVVTVHTGDQPGDTVLHAVSGNTSSDITVHADRAPTPSPTPRHATTPVAASNGNNSTPMARRLLVAGLAALLAAMVGGYVTALVLGRLPNPLQRGRVWGRRSR